MTILSAVWNSAWLAEVTSETAGSDCLWARVEGRGQSTPSRWKSDTSSLLHVGDCEKCSGVSKKLGECGNAQRKSVPIPSVLREPPYSDDSPLRKTFNVLHRVPSRASASKAPVVEG